jgi:hypothetical protein
MAMYDCTVANNCCLEEEDSAGSVIQSDVYVPDANDTTIGWTGPICQCLIDKIPLMTQLVNFTWYISGWTLNVQQDEKGLGGLPKVLAKMPNLEVIEIWAKDYLSTFKLPVTVDTVGGNIFDAIDVTTAGEATVFELHSDSQLKEGDATTLALWADHLEDLSITSYDLYADLKKLVNLKRLSLEGMVARPDYEDLFEKLTKLNKLYLAEIDPLALERLRLPPSLTSFTCLMSNLHMETIDEFIPTEEVVMVPQFPPKMKRIAFLEYPIRDMSKPQESPGWFAKCRTNRLATPDLFKLSLIAVSTIFKEANPDKFYWTSSAKDVPGIIDAVETHAATRGLTMAWLEISCSTRNFPEGVSSRVLTVVHNALDMVPDAKFKFMSSPPPSDD